MMLRQATARDHPGGKAHDAGSIREPEDLQEKKGEQKSMVKGSAERRSPFFIPIMQLQKGVIMKSSNKEKKKIIAIRKTCKTDGTGLSHYILMDKEVKK